MANYEHSRKNNKSVFPENVVDGQQYTRVEHLLTGDMLKTRFLVGIPLVSVIKNPVTNKYDMIKDEQLNDFIMRAVANAEMDIGVDIFEVQRSERHPFDRNLLENYGYFRTEHKPILSIDKLSISPGNATDIYIVPAEWIDTGYFAKGQINIIPLIPAYGTTYLNVAAGSGAVFLQVMAGRGWIPSFWNILYTTGFPDGQVPMIINELVGCYAAIDILSMLATTNINNSHSLGFDGMNQSASNAGPEIYNARIMLLEDKKKKITGKIKALYNTKFVLSNI